MKKFFFFNFLILCCNISAFNFIEFLDASSFRYKLASYIGTDYFPHQENNQNSYLEKKYFTAGWNFRIEKKINIWLDFDYSTYAFTDQVELKRTGISYQQNEWKLSYIFDRLEIGNDSEIFRKNVNSVYYDNPVIEDYKFSGFTAVYKPDRFMISGMIGGNDYNSAIGKFSFGLSGNDHDLQIYYLFCKRDRSFNYPLQATGFDIKVKTNLLRFYNSTVYEYLNSNLVSDDDHEKFIDLTEVILDLHPKFEIGVNLIYISHDWKESEDWLFTPFFALISGKVSNTISYQYWNSAFGFNREFNLITSYDILPYWKLGTNFSYFNPSIGDKYYEIGFQTMIQYEMD